VSLPEEATLRQRPLWHPRTVVGAFSQRRYRQDPLIRGIVKGGAGMILACLVLYLWADDRREERADRRQQHADLLRVMREQHQEDVDLRRLERCTNQQLVDTVRAAIWHEKPRPREDCR
jgi:hypothetical protein